MAASLDLLNAQAWATNAQLYATGGRPDRGRRAGPALPAGAITDARLSAARTMNTRWKGALDSIWQRVELLAVPTLLGFPPLIDEARGSSGSGG